MPETDNFKLIIEDDEGRRSVVPVDLGEVSIGRLEGNTIRLNERNVSRRHARLFRDNGSIVAEDLDSYNGVFINGDRIKGRHEVRDGDLLRIGDFQLELRGEGLQRRTEETTQRTLMTEMETTQPEIRMEGGAQPPSGTGTQPSIPAARMRSEPAEPSPRVEPTAIIRLNHLEDVESSRWQNRTIAGQKAKLVCVSTQFAGQEFEITTTEVIIGRTEENDVAIDHRSVSRHHAKITVVGNSFKVVDLKSANGTLVNGEEYAQTDLKSGDLLELGHVKFRFVPPGENYTFTAEEAAAIQSKGGGNRVLEAGTMPGSSSSPSFSQILRTNPFIVLAIAGLMVMIAVMLAWMTSGDENKGTAVATEPGTTLVDPAGRPLGASSTLAIPVPSASAAVSEVDSMLARANLAMTQREWKQAVDIARGVMAFQPGNVQAQMIADKADVEAAAQANYDNAVAAINGGRWSDAWNHLQLIGADSSYSSQGGGLKDQVHAALITELVASADTAVGKGLWDEALAAAQPIEALDT
ncbi:MAG: FHA domain-containing protein, partial [Myxococcota bacterium]